MNKKLLGILILLALMFFYPILTGYAMNLYLLLVILLIALFTLAFLPANIAKRKGYSFIGFFIFSFFLFIPALIVALCIQPSTQTINEAPLAASSTKITSEKSISDQIIELSELRTKGIIDDDEFRVAKDKLLKG